MADFGSELRREKLSKEGSTDVLVSGRKILHGSR